MVSAGRRRWAATTVLPTLPAVACFFVQWRRPPPPVMLTAPLRVLCPAVGWSLPQIPPSASDVTVPPAVAAGQAKDVEAALDLPPFAASRQIVIQPYVADVPFSRSPGIGEQSAAATARADAASKRRRLYRPSLNFGPKKTVFTPKKLVIMLRCQCSCGRIAALAFWRNKTETHRGVN